MAGDRSLAFVLAGTICATTLWVVNARMIPHRAPAALHTHQTAPAAVAGSRGSAAPQSAFKARLATALNLAPSD